MSERMDDLLFDFWTELDRTGSADPGAVEPALAETIGHLHDLSMAPVPDSTRERIRRKVLDQSVSTEGEELVTLSAAALTLPSSNGHAGPVRAVPKRAAPAPRMHPRFRWAMMAAAVLILLGVMGGLMTYGVPSNRLFGVGGPTEPSPIPAATVQSGWTQFRGGAERTGYTADPGPGGNLDLRWTFTADEVLGTLVSDAGSVYIYGRKGDLYVLDAVTGAQRWGVDLSPSEYSDQNRYPIPAVQNGIIYTGTYEGNVVALDATDGSVVWQRALSTQPIVASPTIVDDAIYIATPDGTIVELDTATGTTNQEFTRDTQLSDWAPAVGGGLLYIADSAGNWVAIDTTTGEIAWVAEVGDAVRNPAYSDGVLYVGGLNGTFSALDVTDGSVIWTSEPATGDQPLNPIVTPNLLIATWMNGPMNALDRKTGEVVWQVDGPGGSLSPHASATAVYGVSRDLASLVAYDLATGDELGRVDTTGLGSVAAISGDTMVFSNYDDPSVVRSFGPGAGDEIEVVAGPSTVIAPATPIAAEVTFDIDTPATVSAGAESFDASQVAFVSEIATAGSTTLVGPLPVVGPDGTLYVVDADLGTIFVLSPDGEFLEQWGEPGTGPGQFNSPQSLGFDADGNIYVFDSFNLRIQKFDPDRTFLMEWGTQGTGNGEFGGEVEGTVDPINGLVYTVDWSGNRVQVFDLEGNFLDKWGSAGTGPGEFVHPGTVAVAPDGLIYVGDTAYGTGARVQIFDKYGTYKGTLLGEGGAPTLFTEVWGIAFDGAGNIYVADYRDHSIRVFDSAWREIGRIADVEGAGPFTHPARLAIDADGNLYVGDYDAARIVKLALPPVDA